MLGRAWIATVQPLCRDSGRVLAGNGAAEGVPGAGQPPAPAPPIKPPCGRRFTAAAGSQTGRRLRTLGVGGGG